MGQGRELLDDHRRVFGAELPRTVPPSAVRMRSVAAREVIARAGLGGTAGLDDLLAAARSGDRRWLSRRRGQVDRPALAALARTIALQDLGPEDRTDATAIYELMRRALGAAALGPAHQAHHAQFAYLYEGPERARTLVAAYPRMRAGARETLRADLANPFAGGTGDGWWDRFTALLPQPWPVLRDDDAVVPFDRLDSAGGPAVEEPQRVSVVVTAYRPGPGLLTAVRSILAQTWRNVEIVLVDDASPAEHDEVLDAAVALGERIRLIRLRRNAGTYAARNVGLDAAGGEFVTFQDSDDWSHPRRLELQVRRLLDDSRAVAATSDSLSVTDELVLTRPDVRGARLNPSSLLFRRRRLLGRIGYFDQVRKGGDSEYLGRIVAALGARALVHVDQPLALIRLTGTSLSRAEVRAGWLHPARAAYASAYLRWHDRVRAGEVSPLRPRDGGDRPYPVPRHLTAGPDTAVHPDVVVAADWRFLEGAQRAALDEIAALRSDGLRVAILHLESLRTPQRRRRPLSPVVQRLIDEGLDRVYAHEPVECSLLIVRHPEVLQFASAEPAALRPGRVLVVADRAPSRSDGTDRRWAPETCTAAVRRLFRAEPVWCPQDDAVRSALARWELPLTPYDLPTVVSMDRFTAPVAPGPAAIVGTDLCDAGVWPGDLAEVLATLRRDPGWDVRLRLPDRPLRPGRLPAGWLSYRSTEVDPRTFLHQLDFYLHFPSPRTVEVACRPALEAAAQGRVVVLPERFAAFFGDAAVYCPPADVPALVEQFRADPDRYAEQARRARLVIEKAHHAGLFLDRVRPARPVPPAQRVRP